MDKNNLHLYLKNILKNIQFFRQSMKNLSAEEIDKSLDKFMLSINEIKKEHFFDDKEIQDVKGIKQKILIELEAIRAMKKDFELLFNQFLNSFKDKELQESYQDLGHKQAKGKNAGKNGKIYTINV